MKINTIKNHYLCTLGAFVVGALLATATSMYITALHGQEIATVVISAKTYKVNTPFTLTETTASSSAGRIYTYSGKKSIDLFYKHDQQENKAFGEDVICFLPKNPLDLSYPNDEDIMHISHYHCIPSTDKLVASLRKTVHQKQDGYYEGAIRATVTGYTLDTRGTEARNDITIEKIDEWYQ